MTGPNVRNGSTGALVPYAIKCPECGTPLRVAYEWVMWQCGHCARLLDWQRVERVNGGRPIPERGLNEE